MIDGSFPNRLIQPRLRHAADAFAAIQDDAFLLRLFHTGKHQDPIRHLRIVPRIFSDGAGYRIRFLLDLQQL